MADVAGGELDCTTRHAAPMELLHAIALGLLRPQRLITGWARLSPPTSAVNGMRNSPQRTELVTGKSVDVLVATSDTMRDRRNGIALARTLSRTATTSGGENRSW